MWMWCAVFNVKVLDMWGRYAERRSRRVGGAWVSTRRRDAKWKRTVYVV